MKMNITNDLFAELCFITTIQKTLEWKQSEQYYVLD